MQIRPIIGKFMHPFVTLCRHLARDFESSFIPCSVCVFSWRQGLALPFLSHYTHFFAGGLSTRMRVCVYFYANSQAQKYIFSFLGLLRASVPVADANSKSINCFVTYHILLSLRIFFVIFFIFKQLFSLLWRPVQFSKFQSSLHNSQSVFDKFIRRVGVQQT